MKTVDELLYEAKNGKLTNKEIDYVAEKLKSCTPDNDHDLYILIHILGLSDSKRYHKEIERFLYYPKNPSISSIALKAVCNYWRAETNAMQYIDLIKSFIKGVEWDQEYEDTKQAALQCAGRLLEKKLEKELLQLIINTYEKLNKIVLGLQKADFFECYSAKFLLEDTFDALACAVGLEEQLCYLRFGASDAERDNSYESFVASVLNKARAALNKLR